MSNCTATLTVSDTTLPCSTHNDLADHPHGGVFIRWHDDAPGAKPHTPPRYRAVETPSGWLVTDDNGPVAMWYLHHPDPEPLALAEAARLNGEDDCLCPHRPLVDQAIRERNEARAERDSAWSDLGMLRGENAALVDERDAFREALEGTSSSEVRGPLRDALWGTP